MNQILRKTFGGLSRDYYLRRLFLGALPFEFLLGLRYYGFAPMQGPQEIQLFILMGLNAFLFPYAAFFLETILGLRKAAHSQWAAFHLYRNTWVFKQLLATILSMLFGPFIAPLGLALLFFRSHRAQRI